MLSLNTGRGSNRSFIQQVALYNRHTQNTKQLAVRCYRLIGGIKARCATRNKDPLHDKLDDAF